MKRTLEGQVAVVTGVSRLRGIGAAICRELATCGADLFLTGWPTYDEQDRVKSDEVDRLLNELEAAGSKVEWMPLDLGLSESSIALLEAASSRFGQAHILINNACFWSGDSLTTLGAELLPGRCSDRCPAQSLTVRALVGTGSCRSADERCSSLPNHLLSAYAAGSF